MGRIRDCEAVESPVQWTGLEVVPSLVLRVSVNAFGVLYWDGDRQSRIPSVVLSQESQLLHGELESGLVQVCSEAVRKEGRVIQVDADRVFQSL